MESVSADSSSLSPRSILAQDHGGDNEDVQPQLLESKFGRNSPSEMKQLQRPVEGSQPEAINSEGQHSRTSENTCDEPSRVAQEQEATEKAENDSVPKSHGIYWRSPVLTISWFVFGLMACVGHHLFYSQFDGAVVESSEEQEWNIRIGSIFALTVKLFLRSAVWLSYTQWLWKTLKGSSISIAGLEAALGVENSMSAFHNLDMIRTLKLGAAVALIAWCLEIPQLIAPATLFVVSSTMIAYNDTGVPSLSITNPSQSHLFAEFTRANTTIPDANPNSWTFDGPKSILTRLSGATGSLGEILPISAPSSDCSYSIQFAGPYTNCTAANSSVVDAMNAFLTKLNNTQLESSSGEKYETFAYAAFVPSPPLNESGKMVNESNGSIVIPFNGAQITAFYQSRIQEQPENASNEVWLYYYRYSNDANDSYVLDANQSDVKYLEPEYSVCNLWNATFNVTFSYSAGLQTITTDTTGLNAVRYPTYDPYVATDMVGLSYSAVFWVLTNQLVGTMSLVQHLENGSSSPYYGSINTNLKQSSILGSNDLDYFFYINSDVNETYSTEYPLSQQRILDKDLAQNQTLPFLIQQLSVNVTVSLLNNVLLAPLVLANVSTINLVNRYSYNARNLWLVYGLASFFTLIAVGLGLWAFKENDASHNNATSIILSLSRNEALDRLFPACCRGTFPQPTETMQSKVCIKTNKDGTLMLAPEPLKKNELSCDRSPRRASVVSKVFNRVRTAEVSLE